MASLRASICTHFSSDVLKTIYLPFSFGIFLQIIFFEFSQLYNIMDRLPWWLQRWWLHLTQNTSIYPKVGKYLWERGMFNLGLDILNITIMQVWIKWVHLSLKNDVINTLGSRVWKMYFSLCAKCYWYPGQAMLINIGWNSTNLEFFINKHYLSSLSSTPNPFFSPLPPNDIKIIQFFHEYRWVST